MRFGLVLLVALATGCGDKKKPAALDAGAAKDAALAVVAHDAALAARADAPTRQDCEAAVSNMQKISPGLVPGDAADLEECMKLPRPLVLCLQTAASSAAADACVDHAATEAFGKDPAAPPAGSVLDPSGAPAPRASAELCSKMVAHYRTLMPVGERDESPEAGMLAACTRELTPSEADCVLAARSLPEAETCLGEASP